MEQLENSLKILIFILYICFVIGIVIYVMLMIGRFVRAHERAADALETIARKMGDGWKA